MRIRTSSRVARLVERVLIGVAVVCLAESGWRVFEMHRLQTDGQAAVERMLAERERGGRLERPSPSGWPTGLVGQLSIPRLHLSTIVMTGDDETVLESAAGYLPDTPLPWQPGNSAVAAHRDGLFRPLEGIRVGDAILLTTPHGDFSYRVRHTMIVNPRDVWVLGPLPHVNLTLITCFPFVYIGHAPQRFIVQAEHLSGL